MLRTVCLILLLVSICSITADKQLQLPSYIKPCSKSGADFEECCRQHGNDIMSIIMKGDREYNIPILDPLVLPSVEMEAAGFKLTLKDLHIYGLDNTEVKKVKFDLNKNELIINTFHKRISLIGKYKCEGKVSVLEIQGEGNMNLTITDLEIKYHEIYKVENRGGEDYITFTDNAEVDFTVSRAYFDLDNLFGGNKQLGDATVKALNDEWEQFVEVLKPGISQTIIEIAHSIAGGVTINVPLKYIFLD